MTSYRFTNETNAINTCRKFNATRGTWVVVDGPENDYLVMLVRDAKRNELNGRIYH